MSSIKILCDRKAFIDCANGDLLIVNKGVIKALGDAASSAMDAHEAGKTIYLTVDGEIVSTVKNFKEEPYVRKCTDCEKPSTCHHFGVYYCDECGVKAAKAIADEGPLD